MKWEMEILESKTSKWSRSENKLFENALAVFDKDTPDRWEKVAEMIPGKTVGDVIRQYKELEMDVNNIEAGLVPVPGYESLKFKLERESTRGYDYDGFQQSYGFVGKRSSFGTGRPSEQERRKGVPWTEEEHKLFLLGLKKYGKGDWRNISRNFVVTRTPTQVASHAQKYFIRQLSGGRDKRRASIHDITTVNLNESRNPSPNGRKPPSLNYPVLPHQQPFQWSHPSSDGAAAAMAFAQPPESMFIPSYSGFGFGFGNKLQRQNVQRSAVGQSIFLPQNMAFQRYPVG